MSPQPLGNVTFVPALVEDHRLRVLADVRRRVIRHVVLHAHMGYPWLGVVEECPLIMNRAQMLVRIMLRDSLSNALKVCLCLGLEVVPLIRQ